MVAVWLVIIGSVLAFALVRNHIAKPTSMPLSETEFLQKFEANQIERATVSYNPQSPAVAKISGTYYRTDKDGNIIKSEKEVPFIVENALITPNLERKLVRSDKIVVNTPNPMLTVVAYNLLFLGGFGMVILLLLGIIIYVVSRVIKRPVGVPVPPVQKPDRFWRWFAVAVFAMIAIPFLISIVGLLAAIAIPNFVKARAQAQENARRAAAQMATNQLPGLNLSFGPVIERILNDPDDDPRNSFLDLDTGTVFDDPVPPPTGNMSVEMRIGFTIGAMDSLLRAIRERRVDLVGDASGNSLAGCDLVALPVASEQFDSALTDTILWRQNETALTNAGEDFVTLHATNTPATWLFKTREGGSGILQITGFTENPRGVKLRYKLVQNIGTTTTSVSMPPTAAPNPSFDSFVERVRKELSRASIRFDRLHISAVNADNFIVSFSGLEAHGVSNGKDSWLPIVGSVGSLVAQRGFFGGKWDFKGLNQLAVVRFTIADLDLEKLLETNLAEAMPASPTTAPNPSFGPVIERVVIESTEITTPSKNGMLDLDSGRLINATRTFSATDPEDFMRWTAEMGVDTYAVFEPHEVTGAVAAARDEALFAKTGVRLPPGRLEGLNAFDMRALSVKNEIWETATPGVIESNLASIKPMHWNYLAGMTNQPATWFFKTREGGMGILQITGFTDNPRGVKLRYRLVQSVAAPASVGREQQIRTALEFAPVVWLRGASVSLVQLSTDGRKATVVLNHPELGPEEMVLTADDAGRFTGSLKLAANGGFPISLLPTDSQRLESQYRSLPAGDAFPPERELVIRRPEGITNCLLGLGFDAGAVVPVPVELGGKLEDAIESLKSNNGLDSESGHLRSVKAFLESLKNNDEVDRWAHDHGVDALAWFGHNEFQIVDFDAPMQMLYLPEGWPHLSPDRVKRALITGGFREGVMGNRLSVSFDNSPIAYAFRTRANAIGAWRFSGKVGDPMSIAIKIRYKLVQNSTSTNSP
jgi:type II secretory pathway pseudopilin PulG